MLEDYLGPATFVLGLILAVLIVGLPFGFEGDSPAEIVADKLAMEPGEQDLIIPPAARILDKKHFAPEVKTRIMSAGDYVGLAIGLGTYLIRTFAVTAQLRGQVQYANTSGTVSQQAAAQNGHQPAGAGPTRNPAAVNVGGFFGG